MSDHANLKFHSTHLMSVLQQTVIIIGPAHAACVHVDADAADVSSGGEKKEKERRKRRIFIHTDAAQVCLLPTYTLHYILANKNNN